MMHPHSEPALRTLTLLVALSLLASACDKSGNKFAMMKPDQGGIIEFPKWPPLAKGVAGYNLYIAEKAAGPFEKLNEEPITGGTMMVPHLKYGTEYCFYLTSQGENGVESKPGGVFKRSTPQDPHAPAKPAAPTGAK